MVASPYPFPSDPQGPAVGDEGLHGRVGRRCRRNRPSSGVDAATLVQWSASPSSAASGRASPPGDRRHLPAHWPSSGDRPPIDRLRTPRRALHLARWPGATPSPTTPTVTFAASPAAPRPRAVPPRRRRDARRRGPRRRRDGRTARVARRPTSGSRSADAGPSPRLASGAAAETPDRPDRSHWTIVAPSPGHAAWPGPKRPDPVGRPGAGHRSRSPLRSCSSAEVVGSFATGSPSAVRQAMGVDPVA